MLKGNSQRVGFVGLFGAGIALLLTNSLVRSKLYRLVSVSSVSVSCTIMLGLVSSTMLLMAHQLRMLTFVRTRTCSLIFLFFLNHAFPPGSRVK